MPENIPGFRRSSFHFIKWLGHDVVNNEPLIRMLHQSRAMAAARQKADPLAQRPSYNIRGQRIFARGNEPAAAVPAAPPAEDLATAESEAVADAEAGEDMPATGI